MNNKYIKFIITTALLSSCLVSLADNYPYNMIPSDNDEDSNSIFKLYSQTSQQNTDTDKDSASSTKQYTRLLHQESSHKANNSTNNASAVKYYNTAPQEQVTPNPAPQEQITPNPAPQEQITASQAATQQPMHTKQAANSALPARELNNSGGVYVPPTQTKSIQQPAKLNWY